MIIFYDRVTGNIVGSIEGRIHPKEHLQMWMGDKEQHARLVVQWKQNENGEYEPDHPQKDLLREVEANSSLLFEYKVNNDMIVKK